jgi:hypothetical protein
MVWECEGMGWIFLKVNFKSYYKIFGDIYDSIVR